MCVPSCTYSTFCDVIHLISRSSVRAGALSLTGYEPSWPLSLLHSVSICVFGALCVTLGHLGSYLSHLCYLRLSGFPVGIYLCLLRWSALSCISALYLSSVGLVELLLFCSAPTWAWYVETCLHILALTTHWCEDLPNSALIPSLLVGGPTRLFTNPFFPFSLPSPPFAAPFNVFLPISTTFWFSQLTLMSQPCEMVTNVKVLWSTICLF